MMNDTISLEDLAMGIVPNKDMKGEKTMPVSKGVKADVKAMADIALAQEALSIKELKKLNKTELKMMIKAADKLQDTLYRTKEMCRAAMPKEAVNEKSGMLGYECDED